MNRSRMFRMLMLAAGLFFLCSLPAMGDEPVTMQSLLREMIDRDAVARLPAPYFTLKQASSYDRTQTDPNDAKTWFNNHDYEQFIRTEENAGRKEWVIMEHDGPGAVVRFWTPLHKPKDKAVIRFYLDGEVKPAIECNFNESMRGRGFIEPPFAFIAWPGGLKLEGVAGDLYFPIPFAKSCKITLDELPFYYAINYRAYEPGTKVKSFSRRDYNDFSGTKMLADKAAKDLRYDGCGEAKGRYIANDVDTTVEPGQTKTLDFPAGPGAIRKMVISVPSENKETPDKLQIEMTFDGETTVCCPLNVFFSYGIKQDSLWDWYRVEVPHSLCSKWTMPYEKTASVTLKSPGKTKMTVGISAIVGDWKWDDRSMHFHANWRHQDKINTKEKSDWNYIEIKGQGVYVGDTLTVHNPVKDWYGEGDERIYIDGEKFPSQLGTGTEDYYGYAWGMADKFSSPFIAMPERGKGRDDWTGYTTTSRVRLLDGIPFKSALKFDMEIWHWAATDVSYSAATFWYARPGATSNRPPQPEEAGRSVRENVENREK